MGRLTQLRMILLPDAGDKATNPSASGPFENSLSAKLEMPVPPSQYTKDYAQAVEALAQGNVEVAWLGPLSYLYTVEKCQAKPLLCTLDESR
ncbi:MAG: PhnD/SsuA/transferrin family substrate-binding protein [Ktedonobacteraceae bacterium]|nr:PhnD/SsuA/transferrin family substrate-binding protein [Ktedonobacteraceae bacterium]